jgi:mRNA interferase RelE/StbE
LVCRIEYKSSVSHDLRQLDKKTAGRILSQIGDLLSVDPAAGERLHGEFAGLFKLRLGEYRVIYARIASDRVLILALGTAAKPTNSDLFRLCSLLVPFRLQYRAIENC